VCPTQRKCILHCLFWSDVHWKVEGPADEALEVVVSVEFVDQPCAKPLSEW